MYENGTSYENIQPTAEQIPVQQVAPAPAVYVAEPMNPIVPEPTPEPKKKKKSKFLIVSIIINILLILGIIASVVFFYVIPKIKDSEAKEEPVVEATSEYAFFNQGLVVASKGDKYGFVNEEGEWVIQPQFEWTSGFADNGLAGVMTEYNDVEDIIEVGFINTKGEFVIEPLEVENVGRFSHGVATVTKYNDDGEYEYAIIDEKGNFVVDYGKYDYIGYYTDETEYYEVEKDGKYGIINTAGEEVVALGEYEYIYGVYSDGFIFAEDKKLGFADYDGNVIIEPKLEKLGYADCESLCEEDGCYEYAYYDEYCEEHTEMPYCLYVGCRNRVDYYYDDYCYEHSGLPYCSYSDCYNRVDSYGDEYCWEHSYYEDEYDY